MRLNKPEGNTLCSNLRVLPKTILQNLQPDSLDRLHLEKSKHQDHIDDRRQIYISTK